MTTETTPPAAPDAKAAAAPRPSEPDAVWVAATGIFWGLVFAAVIGVWKASQEVGLATWWRGPRSAPRPILVQILPLVAPSLMIVGSVMRWPRLPQLGLVASLVTAIIGLGDLASVPKLAAVELAIGASGVVFSVAALGAHRALRPTAP